MNEEIIKYITSKRLPPDPEEEKRYAAQEAEAAALRDQSARAGLASGLQSAADKFGMIGGKAVQSDTSAFDDMAKQTTAQADSIAKSVGSAREASGKNRTEMIAEWLKDKRAADDRTARKTQWDEKRDLEIAENKKDRDARMEAAKISGENKQNLAATANTDKLRGYRDSHDITKKTNAIEQAYQGIQGAAQNPSAAGDLSLIFQYMKILDPGSTVREGEFANAQNAAGVPDQIVNMYNRVKSGERLADNQRKDFVSQAGNLRNQQRAIQEGLDKQVRALAEKRGMSTEDVIFDPFADVSTQTADNSKKESAGFNLIPEAKAADLQERLKKLPPPKPGHTRMINKSTGEIDDAVTAQDVQEALKEGWEVSK